MRKYLLSLVAVVLLIPALGLAADIRTAEVVSKEETPSNLYLAGQKPTIDANISKDLVVAGGDVVINGNVENNVLAAGSTLNLSGKVGENVRVAGGTVVLDGEVAGDVVVFSGDVTLGTKSVVSGDVIVFAGTVTFKGKVLGSVKTSYAGDVSIIGSVDGNVEFKNVGTLTLDSTAVIGGDLVYSSQKEAVVSSSAKVGGDVNYTKLTATDATGKNFSSNLGGILFGILTAFITLLIFIKLAPKLSKKVLESALVNPWAQMGTGFLAMVVTPIALFLLLLTFVGWGVMGYLGLAYATIFALTGTFTALFIGSLVWKYLRKESELVVNWKTALIGVILVAVAKMIPVVGWLAALAVALIVFGTLTTMGYEYLKSQKA